MGPPHQPMQQPIRQHHGGIPQPHYLAGSGPYSAGPHLQPQQQPNYPSQPGGPLPQPPQPGAPPYPPDNINALQRAISTMEDRGLQDDPRYSALLAMRAKQGGMAPTSHSPGPSLDPNRYWFPFQVNEILFFFSSISSIYSRPNVASPYGPPNSAPINGNPSGPEGANSMKSSFLSSTQVLQLRAQIMAYRYLSRNQPVPSNIGMAAQGKRTDLPPLQSQLPSSGLQPDQQPSQLYGAIQSQPGQPFQRPQAPVVPPVPMQPANVRPVGPSYPPQQAPTPPSVGQPSQAPPMAIPSSVTPTPGTTASPVPGTIPTPRPTQPQVCSLLSPFLENIFLILVSDTF